MHYYSQNIGDYRRDTVHLSLLEHGAYRQLIDTYYLSEKPLSLDHAVLMRTHCARTADEMQAVENVLKDFFVRTEDGYIHKRCDVEIEAFHSKSTSASESAKARWDRVKAEKEAAAMRTHSDGNANDKPRTTNQEPQTTNQGTSERHGAQSAPKSPRKRSAKPVNPNLIGVEQLIAEGVEEQHAKDWLAVRAVKNLPLTLTAWEGTKEEAAKAKMTPPDAVKYAATNGHAGFKASWVAKEALGQNTGSAAKPGQQSADEVNAEARRILGFAQKGDVIDA